VGLVGKLQVWAREQLRNFYEKFRGFVVAVYNYLERIWLNDLKIKETIKTVWLKGSF
jgi:hypothetical protein